VCVGVVEERNATEILGMGRSFGTVVRSVSPPVWSGTVQDGTAAILQTGHLMDTPTQFLISQAQ